MVQLSIVSTRNNAFRWYPVTGFLGLTQVKVEGIVRTRLEDDGRYLAATRIEVAVRCYEERLGRSGTARQNILAEYTSELWRKRPGSQSELIGDKDLAFSIIIPRSNPGVSMMNFPSYRVYWRLEATCHHMPMIGLGTRLIRSFELALVRYDSRKSVSVANPAPFQSTRGKKHSFRLEHQVALPTSSIGPLDIIPVTVRLRIHGDERARVSAISLSVQRRVTLHDSTTTSESIRSPTDDSALLDAPSRDDLSFPSPSGSDVALLAHHSASTSSAAAATTARRQSSLVIATIDATNLGIDPETDCALRTLYVSLPPAKSANHWALGETLKTPLASISFYVLIRATIILSNGQQEHLDLPPTEMLMNATNHGERQAVRDKYPEFFKSHRPNPSKHRSNPVGSSSGRPRTSRGERGEMDILRDQNRNQDRERRNEHETSGRSGGEGSGHSRSRSRMRSSHPDKPKSAGAEGAPVPGATSSRQQKSRRPHTAGGDASRRSGVFGSADGQRMSISTRRSSREMPGSAGTTPNPVPAGSTSSVSSPSSSAPQPLQNRSRSHGSSATSLAMPITPGSTSSVNLIVKDSSPIGSGVNAPCGTAPESSTSVPQAPSECDVLAWEAELERIELRSRQRSVQMGNPRRSTVMVAASS